MTMQDPAVTIDAEQLKPGDRILTLGYAPNWHPMVLEVTHVDTTATGTVVVHLEDGAAHEVHAEAQITTVRPSA